LNIHDLAFGRQDLGECFSEILGRSLAAAEEHERESADPDALPLWWTSFAELAQHAESQGPSLFVRIGRMTGRFRINIPADGPPAGQGAGAD
jgi:hypothetical protein